MRSLLLTLVFAIAAATAVAQRPVESDAETPAPRVPSAPSSFKARYEGGMLGFSDREKGTLKFDDENKRLVFLGKDGKEKFALSYDILSAISPQSRSVTSTTGQVVRHVPLPGAVLGGFIREKRRYLVLQFVDPDADLRGTTSFRVDNKDLLDSVIQTLGEKAGMSQRGDAYYRPRN